MIKKAFLKEAPDFEELGEGEVFAFGIEWEKSDEAHNTVGSRAGGQGITDYYFYPKREGFAADFSIDCREGHFHEGYYIPGMGYVQTFGSTPKGQCFREVVTCYYQDQFEFDPDTSYYSGYLRIDPDGGVWQAHHGVVRKIK